MLANIYLTPEGVVGDKTTFFTLSEDTAFKKELYSYPSMKTRAVSPWTKETPPPEDYYDNIIDDSLEENSFITFYCDSIYWDGNESTMNKTGNGSAESPWRNLFYALDNMSVISKVIDCCYYRIVISGVVNYLCIGWDDRTFSVNGRKVYLDFTNADVLAEYGACDLIIRNSVFINLSIRNISDDIGIIRIVGSKLYNIQIDSSVSAISFTCYNCITKKVKLTGNDNDKPSVSVNVYSGIIEDIHDDTFWEYSHNPDSVNVYEAAIASNIKVKRYAMNDSCVSHKITANAINKLSGYIYFSFFNTGENSVSILSGTYIYASTVYRQLKQIIIGLGGHSGDNTVYFGGAPLGLGSCENIFMCNSTIKLDVDTVESGDYIGKFYSAIALYINQYTENGNYCPIKYFILKDCKITSIIHNKLLDDDSGCLEAGIRYRKDENYVVISNCDISRPITTGEIIEDENGVYE